MSDQSFVAFAAIHKPRIDKQLHAILMHEKAAAKDVNEPYYDVLKQLDILIGRGGKRLRPLICLIAYEGYGGQNGKAATRVATSQELLHAFLLIHDDIVDRDYHRWGDRNVAGVYFERYSKTMTSLDAMHYAQAQALLAGDICVALANEVLLTNALDQADIAAAYKLQQRVILRVISGELADTAFSTMPNLPTEDQLLQMYRDKTASYSFGLPLQIGALLAGADSRQCLLLNDMAEELGVAFQLQDDLLGMYGDGSQTGKPALSDLREGKRTLLVLKALEMTTDVSRVKLLSLLGDGRANQASLKSAQTIIDDCGARAYITNLAEQLSRAALSSLDKTSMNTMAKNRLRALVNQLSGRDR